MTTREVIELTDVSLAYRVAHSSAGSVKEFAISALRGRTRYERLWAVRDVSLTVGRGEVVAIVGRNGAGKSTLLKLIARVLPPSNGRIVVRGSVAPMIELSAGFNGELTGIENIVLFGAILGRDPAAMRERAAAIAEWAELGHFLDAPIRTYSSGMLARLGFAVATDVQPEVLVVDEVLSVGDESFQRKSRERIESMIRSGTSVILVSHDLPTVRDVATRAVWLEKGSIRMEGSPAAVVDAYLAA